MKKQVSIAYQMSLNSVSALPMDIINHDIMCLLSFTDAVSLSMTSKLFNGAIKYNHNPTIDDQFAIIKAVQNNNVDAIKCLLKVEYIDPALNDNEPLIRAIKNNSSALFELLLKDPRVNPAARNNLAVRIATSKNKTDMLQLLLADPRVNPSDMDNDALIKAAYMNNHDSAKMLLGYGKLKFNGSGSYRAES
jgi:hypothetical protein